MGDLLATVVLYRGKQGLQTMRAAVVTADATSLDPRGVEAGLVQPLDSPTHVHLWVYTPAAVPGGGFPEFNIPLGEPDADGQIPPGTWCPR